MVRREILDASRLRAKNGQPRILPVRVDFEGQLPYDLGAYLDRIQYVLWKPKMPFDAIADGLLKTIDAPEAPDESTPQDIRYQGNEELYDATEAIGAPLPAADPRLVATLETGTLQVDSPFYVRRASDDEAEACLKRGTPTIIVKGPRQMGKSSLLARMHAQAQKMGRKSWYRDLQYLDERHMKDLDTLFRCLAREMARAFATSIQPKDFWDEEDGPTGNLTRYLEDAILAEADEPVQIIFDEAERIFDRPYRNQFFAAIRGWHNDHAVNDNFKKLSIVIGHATTPALWIKDINQSPFNVGHRMNLRNFEAIHIAELARRHDLALSSSEVDEIIALLVGHPYLTRAALHALVSRSRTLEQLLGVASNETGPFSDHLRGLAWILHKTPEMRSCLLDIVHGKACHDEEHFQRLWAAGLIRGNNRTEAKVRCRLYEDYFRCHL